jgi:hypothetical protein
MKHPMHVGVHMQILTCVAMLPRGNDPCVAPTFACTHLPVTRLQPCHSSRLPCPHWPHCCPSAALMAEPAGDYEHATGQRGVARVKQGSTRSEHRQHACAHNGYHDLQNTLALSSCPAGHPHAACPALPCLLYTSAMAPPLVPLGTTRRTLFAPVCAVTVGPALFASCALCSASLSSRLKGSLKPGYW